jgi:AbrB family looped-hinge helix DNA binding protein
MTEIVEMGTVSSRGQICVPNGIREIMGLKEGTKILFFLNQDSLLIKKVNAQSFEEITRPLREAVKKSGLKESDVTDIIHKLRKVKE